MANVKKGTLTPPAQWWKHLRDWKRRFWKGERKAHDQAIEDELGLPPEPLGPTSLPVGPMCGRCYEEGVPLFPANCKERPELLREAPIGMYHCPDCGAMVLAGIEHPDLCALCLAREHPSFDRPAR